MNHEPTVTTLHCRPSDWYPFHYVTKCARPTPIYPPTGGDPIGCSNCGSRFVLEEVAT